MYSWKAQWIMPKAFDGVVPEPVASEHLPEAYKNKHFWFYKTVQLDSVPENCTMAITADDYYMLYINDVYVCQGPCLSFLFHYAWNRVDVTPWLRPGENRIAVHVYTMGVPSYAWVSGDKRCGLLAELRAGEALLAATGTDWLCAEDHRYLGYQMVGYETQFLEHYDCRIPLTEPVPALLVPDPVYELEAEPVFTISIRNKKPTRSWVLPPDAEKRPAGAMLYDFGGETVGYIRLSLKGHAGDRIRLLAGEELLNNGDPDAPGIPEGVRYRMRCNCDYDETIILDEGANQIRQYDYKAFRYVEIQPLEGSPVWELSVDASYAPFDYDRFELDTNDTRLAQIFKICKEAVRVGTQERFMDCPQREKGQYGGDMTVTSHSHLWLTGDATMLERGTTAQLDSARVFPGILCVAPATGTNSIADYSLQLPILVKRHYTFTGDLAYLKKAIPVLTDMVNYFRTFMNADGLLENVNTMWNLVDWPSNLRDGYDFHLENPLDEGPHCVLNAFWAGCLRVYEELCDIAGFSYTPMAEKVKAAFNELFFDKERIRYRDSPKTTHSACQSNYIPLYYNLYPEEHKDVFIRQIVDYGIHSGVYMSYFMLHGLCNAGYRKEAYQFLVSDSTWYNMVKEGATTCFEAWGKDQKNNCSLCHPWASAPISVLIEGILGYRLDGTRMEPELPEGITAKLVWKH